MAYNETISLAGATRAKPPFDLQSLTVKDVMTLLPVTVDEDMDVIGARTILRERKIRHLPVTHGGKLTGVLSERDTRLVALMPEIAKVKVADIMIRKPATISAGTLVLDAILKMVGKKYGCLIVTEPNGKIAGIFTTQDALRLILREQGHEIPQPNTYPLRECDDDEDLTDIDDDVG